MTAVLYYPLINMDSSGNEKQPMFPTENENTVRAHHGLWLRETMPKHYRLFSAEKLAEKVVDKFRIHCPNCGNVMTTFGKGSGDILPVYVCRNCAKDIPLGRGKSL